MAKESTENSDWELTRQGKHDLTRSFGISPNRVEIVVDFLKAFKDEERSAYYDLCAIATQIIEDTSGYRNKQATTERIDKKLGIYPEGFPHWMDHLARWKEDGKWHVTAEPYELSFADLVDMVKVSRERGLRIWLSGMGYHFSGRTIGIEISRADGKDW